MRELTDEVWLESCEDEIPATLAEMREARGICGISYAAPPLPPTPLLATLSGSLDPGRTVLVFDCCKNRSFNRKELSQLIEEMQTLHRFMLSKEDPPCAASPAS